MDDKRFISDLDKAALELANANRQVALANAKKCLVENELAEVKYKNLVLQLYLKYQLSSSDLISEDGEIKSKQELPTIEE